MKWQTTWREFLLLIFGRVFNRAMVVSGNILLFFIWGPTVHGRYASVVGTWSVLSALTSLGIERSVLKLIPRYQRIGAYLTGYFVGLLLLICLALLAVITVIQIIVSGGGEPPFRRLEVQVVITCLLLGNSLCLSSIGRAHGRPLFDAINSVATGLAICPALGLTYYLRWAPLEFTYAYNAVLLTANLVALLFLLPHMRFSLKKRRAFGHACKWSVEMFMMSLNLVLATTAVSVTYLCFRLAGTFEQASYFNIAALVFGMAYAFFHYCLGIMLPSLSLSIKEHGAGWVYAHLRRNRKLLLIIISTASTLAAGGFIYLRVNHHSLPSYVGPAWFWLLLTPFFLLAEFLTVTFELLERPQLISSTWANALALLLVSACALVTVPMMGAVGGIISLLVGEIFVCAYLLARLKATAGRGLAVA